MSHSFPKSVRARLDAPSAARVESAMEGTSEPWDQIITRLGLMTEDELISHLSHATDIPVADTISIQATPKSLNAGFLNANRLAVIDDTPLTVGIVDPYNEGAMTGVRFCEPDANFALITHSQFETLSAQSSANDDLPGAEAHMADMDRLNDLASAEPVVRKVDSLIASAKSIKASDLHIEPQESGYVIRHRKDGALTEQGRLSLSEGLAVSSRIKILARLDIAERNRPQDGRLTYPVAGHNIDLRVSAVPTDFGESIVVRLLDQSAVTLDFASLGYTDDQEALVRAWLSRSEGLILVTGPTGSGKTTSLYTFLDTIADGSRKILTIEDPIEYRLKNVTQSQIDRAREVTFAKALRSFLRHDPDVMLVGEIRDLETAKVCIEAAQTGHLVLSTLHTNNAASAVTRLKDLGVEPYLIASTLTGVIGQRLVGVTCSHCSGYGCAVCGQSGRDSRIAVLEALTVTPATQDAIRAGRSETDLMATDPAFVPMAEDASRKIHTHRAIIADVGRLTATRGVS